MSLRFSDDGPAFPHELVDAMLNGDVVFLCGAGVSAPQLPMFGELVDLVYPHVGLEPTPAERATRASGRYEEVLGAVSRRLADPSRIYDAVTNFLSRPPLVTAHHKTLLRLSRARDNKILLVTTNFDGRFERGLDEMEGLGSGKAVSLAGQALPPPGTEACHGIIHLHGRIRDAAIGLDATPLVLTSAEYGDAYMRSGWASRFLFDLVRCKTLVLVGYSAGDAPVRYFLNLLEGDRVRFADVHTVYALDAYEDEQSETAARWETIAVTPLGYRKADGLDRHEVLWRDLARLADLVEQPTRTRRERCITLVQKPFATTSESERDEVEWLLRGKANLWDVASARIADPAWFDHFEVARLWPESDGPRIVVNWCCQNLVDRTRLETAINWHGRVGRTFAQALEQRIALSLEKIPRPWAQAWRILARTPPRQSDIIMHHFRLARALESPLLDDHDLRSAVEAITPRIRLGTRWWVEQPHSDPVEAKSVHELVNVSLAIDDAGDLDQLTVAIRQVPNRDRRIAQLCTEALLHVGAAAEDIGIVTGERDSLDQSVPSVAEHNQNQHRDGAVHLCVVLTGLLPTLAAADRDYARALARSWREIPGVLGQRLWVHALSNAHLFSDDEATLGLLDLPTPAFWSMRRELVLTMQERLSGASPDAVKQIVRRILLESQVLYSEFEMDEGVDWRPQARDHRVWLLLTAIRLAGVLPEVGHQELAAVAARYPFITGDYEEADLFGSYSTGVHSVQGNPEPLIEANAEQRLDIARTLRNERDFTVQLGWSAYCMAQPAAAFEALTDGKLDEENAGLWFDFLQVLITSTVTANGANKKAAGLVLRAFERLTDAPDAFLARQLSPLSYLLDMYAADVDDHDAACKWWDRLWKLAELNETPVDGSETDRFYDRVINRPSGRLVEWLLISIDRRKDSVGILDGDRHRLRAVVASDSAAGWFGRGALAHNAGFLLHVDCELALGPFRKSMSLASPEGSTLRAVLLGGVPLDLVGTRVYKRILFRAVCETAKADSGGAAFASRVLHPLMNWRMRPGTDRPPVSPFEVRRLLTHAPQAVLAGVAQVLRQWLVQLPGSPGHAWPTFIGPLFESIWPTEARFRRTAVSRELAELCVSAGPAFEQAFDGIRHFLTPFEGDWSSVSFIKDSDAVRRSPTLCLELVWLVCGPGASGHSNGLSNVLDQIATASPALAVDRRLQWLEQNRVIRYE